MSIAREITDYYAALNELHALLADGLISASDYTVQHNLLYQLRHEADHA